jgi:hypothetical protein
VKAVTCNKVLSCLKAMFRFAEERGYVAENGHPARRVKLSKAIPRFTMRSLHSMSTSG